jgi:hypothetical protein
MMTYQQLQSDTRSSEHVSTGNVYGNMVVSNQQKLTEPFHEKIIVKDACV